MNEECGDALNDSSKIGGSIMLAVPSPRSSLRDLAGTRVFSPPSTIVHSRWTGPMPMESAFLPSQSAFPGLPPREEIVEDDQHRQPGCGGVPEMADFARSQCGELPRPQHRQPGHGGGVAAFAA